MFKGGKRPFAGWILLQEPVVDHKQAEEGVGAHGGFDGGGGRRMSQES
jgi:hypothetical protein